MDAALDYSFALPFLQGTCEHEVATLMNFSEELAAYFLAQVRVELWQTKGLKTDLQHFKVWWWVKTSKIKQSNFLS